LSLDSGKDRGNFYHECYRIEEAMGREWLEIGMAPAREYFRRGRTTEREAPVDKRDERLFASMVRRSIPQRSGRLLGYGMAAVDR
jgi:hypothetical protein